MAVLRVQNGAGSCPAAPSALRPIENVQNRRRRSQPCPRRWKHALLVCQPDASASGYIPARLLVPVSLGALTKAFWDVSQQLLQQGPGPRCPLGALGGLFWAPAMIDALWFPVALCFPHLVFCGCPLLQDSLAKGTESGRFPLISMCRKCGICLRCHGLFVGLVTMSSEFSSPVLVFPVQKAPLCKEKGMYFPPDERFLS